MIPVEDKEAADWFAALRKGAMSLDERQRYDSWRAHPANQAALNRMHELWGELSAIREMDIPRAVEPRRKRGLVIGGVAAALAVVLAGSGYWYVVGRSTIVTGIGEQQTATLSDGSVVALNVVTRLHYDMGAKLRQVALADGEAAFFVKKDHSRPFIVHAGGYQVRAVGTAFNVSDRDGLFDVAVKEGVVAVQRDGGGGPEIHIAAGQQFHVPVPAAGSVALAPALANVSSVAPQSVDEWRLRIVSYQDAPTRTIVQDVNRFYDKPVALASEELASRRVTLRLKMDERSETITNLANMLDADVREQNGVDTLVPRAPAR